MIVSNTVEGLLNIKGLIILLLLNISHDIRKVTIIPIPELVGVEMETGISVFTNKVIVCVNLMDEAEKKRIHIDIKALEEYLKALRV